MGTRLLVECNIPILAVINASLQEGVAPQHFNKTVVRPLLKKPLLGSTLLDNFQPDSNLSFLGKVVEKVIARQLEVSG